MKRALLYIGIAFAAIGCTKDQTTTPTDGVINLSAGVATTRVSSDDDCAWADNDEVGIFTDQGENNLLFTISNTATGALENASDTPLYTLPSGTRTFYAYHPYHASSSDVDWATQGYVLNFDYNDPDHPTLQSEFLLWASTTSNSTEVALQFTHMFPKVTFNLTAGGVDVTSLEGATATLSGANSAGTFGLKSGEFTITAAEDIDLEIGADGTITAYLPPTAAVAENVKLWITAEDNIFVNTFTTSEWQSGSSYEYDITVGEQAAITNDGEGNYFVYAAEGLWKFADLVNSGNLSFNCTLMKDIDLEGVEWTPIGGFENLYSGTFDGGGYLVSGLSISSSDNCVGLFCSNSGTISNLGVSGSVSGNSTVGGVVGVNDGGTLINCYYTGSVSGVMDVVGGVVGQNWGGTLTNCYNSASVSSDMLVGGVVGGNYGTITNCYNTGNVSGNTLVGGVVGVNDGGTLTNCYNTGDVDGEWDYGGVAGYNGGTLTNCYNTGSVSGDTDIGGVVGSNEGTLTNCYYLESVTSDDDATAKSETEMQSAEFVTTLNNNAYDYNNPTLGDAPTVAACAWVAVDSDYPTLDFDAEPTQPEND